MGGEVGGGGGAGRAHASPYGTQFFHFRIHFCRKAPMSEVHAPPNGSTPPLREILDPPLRSIYAYLKTENIILMYTCFKMEVLYREKNHGKCSATMQSKSRKYYNHWRIRMVHHGVRPPQTGSISFVFEYVFAEKCLWQ